MQGIVEEGKPSGTKMPLRNASIAGLPKAISLSWSLPVQVLASQNEPELCLLPALIT